MKKKILSSLVFVMMLLALTGCGKEENKDLVCKSEINQSGIVIQMTATGSFGSKSEKLNDFKMEYFYDYTEMFKQSGVEITEDVAEEMKDSIKEELEKQFKTQKGIEIKEIRNDGSKFYITITGDNEVFKKEYTENFKKGGEFTYDGFKSEYEGQGLTCE